MNQKSIPTPSSERFWLKARLWWSAMSRLGKTSVAIGLLGFFPWIVLSVQAPQSQALAAWFCWTVICAAIAISRKTQGKEIALWVAWTVGDVVVLTTALWSGGTNWELEKNLPLLAAGFVSLAVSLKIESFEIGKRHRWFAEVCGCLALTMGHVIIWQFYLKEPPVGFFFLLSPIAGITSPVISAVDEWRKNRKIAISTIWAIPLGLVLFCLMAT